MVDEDGKTFVSKGHWKETEEGGGADASINEKADLRFPIFYQFDETLLNNYAFTTWVAHFDTLNYIDLVPNLNKGESYDQLIRNNTSSNGEINGFSVPSNKTLISDFKLKFPEYQSRIDAL